MAEQENTKFNETLANIAFQCGRAVADGSFEVEDACKFVSDMIAWAREFEDINKSEDWTEKEYIDTVDAFTESKITPATEKFTVDLVTADQSVDGFEYTDRDEQIEAAVRLIRSAAEHYAEDGIERKITVYIGYYD